MQWLSQGSASEAVVAQSGLGSGWCRRWRRKQGRRWLRLQALVTAVAQGGGSIGCGSGSGHGQWRAAAGGGGSKRKEAGREDDMNSKRLPLLLLL